MGDFVKTNNLVSGIVLLFMANTTYAGFNEAVTAYDSGDFKRAFIEAKPSADRGDPSAQYLLGVMYYNGEGVSQDYKESVKWLKLSAAQGNLNAQFNLSNMYRKGEGVTANYEESFKWALPSAEQGDAVSQFLVGVSYYTGMGVQEDAIKAYAWFSVSSAGGYSNAIKYRDILVKKLTPADLEKGQILARQYFDKYQSK